MSGESRIDHSGRATNVVQAGQIHGDVHIHAAAAPVRERVTVCALGGDRTWAEWIRGALGHLGFTAERQTWRFVAGDDLTGNIARLRASGERIVLIHSLVSLRSPFYKQLAGTVDRERALIVQVGDVMSPEQPDVTIRPNDSHAEALAGMRTGLAARDWPYEEQPTGVDVPYPGRGPRVNNLPPRNPDFTGRADVLDEVATRLLTDDLPVAGCAFLGMTGVGKSQAAIEYAHRYHCHYDLIWRVIAEEQSTVHSDLAALAQQLDVRDVADPRAMILGLRQRLAELDRWLIIFDNAEDREALRQYWPGTGGHVLITSNRDLAWRALSVRELRLDVLGLEDAVTFLRKRLDWLDEDVDEEIGAIARELGRLPLALDQAAGYITGTRCSPRDYLALLRDRLPDLLDVEDFEQRQHRTVAATLRLTLNRVRTQDPAAEDFLVACAFLAPEGIPRSLFTDHADALPPRLRTVATDSLAYGKALEILRRYSLLEIDGPGLSVHRLVQVIARESRAEIGELAGAVIRLLAAAFPARPLEAGTYTTCAQLLPHVTAVRRFHHLGVAQDELASLLVRCGIHLAEWQKPELALDLLGHAHRILGDEPTAQLADLLAASGRAHFELAQLSAAEQETELALRILTGLHGAGSPRTLYAMLRLGNILTEQADLDSAKDVLGRALSIARDARVLDAFGTVLWRQGRVAEALRRFTEALSLAGQEDPDGADAAMIHGHVTMGLRELGRLDEAEEHQIRARDIYVAHFGERAMLVARARIGLARILLKRGLPAQAHAEAVPAMDILEEWQADHPNTASGLNTFGDALRALGRPGEAAQAHRRAWQIFTRTYGPDHPYNAEALRRLGKDHHRAGDLHTAEETLRHALRILSDHYGPDYLRAAPCMAALSAVLAEQGKQGEADLLAHRADELRALQVVP